MLQRVRIGTHHLSDLQHYEAVEGIHAQGAVLLSAQFDGCADLSGAVFQPVGKPPRRRHIRFSNYLENHEVLCVSNGLGNSIWWLRCRSAARW